MFTPLYFKLLEMQTRFCTSVGASPISFDPKRRKCFIKPHSRIRALFCLLYWIVFTLFCCGRTIEISLHSDNKLENRHFHMCYATSQLTLIVLVALVITNEKQDVMANAMSQVLLFVDKFKSKGVK